MPKTFTQLVSEVSDFETASKTYQSVYVGPWDFAEEFEIYSLMGTPSDFKIECLGISTWICTDTQVGLHAYYFEQEFVGLSTQKYRKSNKNFFWVSEDAYRMVRTYLESLVEDQPMFNAIPENLEIDEFFFQDHRW